jgi:hypothetical protein
MRSFANEMRRSGPDVRVSTPGAMELEDYLIGCVLECNEPQAGAQTVGISGREKG